MKRTPLKRKTPLKTKKATLKRASLRRIGKSTTAQIKREIQALLREYVMLRDGDCILKKYRHCNDKVKQADHLITRANSATYADERLVVCLCRTCHGWKHWHKEEYDLLVKSILPKDRVNLWERCQEEVWKPQPQDWKLHIIRLKKIIDEKKLKK